jgi:hypothetical protein
MTLVSQDALNCPYCGNIIAEISSDHVFPEFLGGRRTITSCKNCNSTFGHTIEAKASENLKPLYVLIATWGVSLKSTEATWREAYTVDGMPLDLSVTKTGVTARLSKPIVKKDETGNIVRAVFQGKDGKKFERAMLQKGKNFRSKPAPIQTNLKGMGFTISLNRDLCLTSLKMSLALLSLLSDLHPSETENARRFLNAPPESIPLNSLVDNRLHVPLDSKRPALSHLIYVERNRSSTYSVVQFFGTIQLYWDIGKSRASATSESALLACLDPVTGVEDLRSIEPLFLSPPPPFSSSSIHKLAESWLSK